MSESSKQRCFANVEDRVIVITGAAGGLGATFAQVCEGRGARLILMDTDGDALAALHERLSSDVRAVVGSVLIEDDVARVIDVARKEHGRIDCLINLAGGSSIADGDVLESSPDEWRRVIELDLVGSMLMCRGAVPLLRAGVCPSIINTSSVVTRRSVPVVGYAAAKAGVEGLTLSLVSQLHDSGVRANTVCLGPVGTSRLLTRRAAHGQDTSDLMKPDDVIGLYLFLASEAARSLNGAVILADGGRSLL